MEIISATALISINETFIIQLISFLIFLFVLNKVMIKPLRGIENQRNAYIDQIKEEVETEKEKLEMLSADFEKQKSAAMKEAFTLSGAIENEADSKAAEIFSAAKENARKIKEEAESDIQEKISSARASLEKEADLLTTIIMEKILDRRLVKDGGA